MHEHEARLRAMLDDNGTWDLSEADRAAIRWAFEVVAALRDDLYRARQEYIKELDRGRRLRESIQGHAAEIIKSLAD